MEQQEKFRAGKKNYGVARNFLTRQEKLWGSKKFFDPVRKIMGLQENFWPGKKYYWPARKFLTRQEKLWNSKKIFDPQEKI